MKVCKFEKMKEEDEIRQVINYTLKEHPYVVVVPTLTQLQECCRIFLSAGFMKKTVLRMQQSIISKNIAVHWQITS